MAKPVADVVGGGTGVQLRDDFTWALLPGQADDVLAQEILADLEDLGRHGQPVANLHDTAVAGAALLPGELTWHGDWSDDREKAIERYRREQGGPAGGPVP